MDFNILEDKKTFGFTLTWGERLKGFVFCFALGTIINIVSVFMLWKDIRKFAILFSLGNILSTMSSFFLVGPRRQWKSMWKSGRMVATSMYVISTILTVVFAVQRKNGAAIVSCVIQWLAQIWYNLSFIPGARAVSKRFATCIV